MSCLLVSTEFLFVCCLIQAFQETPQQEKHCVSKHHIIYYHSLDPYRITESTWIWKCQSQWPCDLRRGSAAARLLRSWVRIPPEAWMFVCCECRVLSGRGLCDELITRPEESCRLWCVVVCDLENLVNEEAMTRIGSQCHRKKNMNMEIVMFA